jgi:hypothetical protein
VTSLREGRNMGDDTKFVVMQHEKWKSAYDTKIPDEVNVFVARGRSCNIVYLHYIFITIINPPRLLLFSVHDHSFISSDDKVKPNIVTTVSRPCTTGTQSIRHSTAQWTEQAYNLQSLWSFTSGGYVSSLI